MHLKFVPFVHKFSRVLLCEILINLLCYVYFQDDDSMDKDGNELDGECSRPQKHAKSPELAREFLLDAATVIFKEQACSVC